MGFFDMFKRTCKDCEYYSEYKSQTKLLPDKTVIDGKLECMSCEIMNAELKDIKKCSIFKERSGNTCMSAHAMLISIKRK